jgi:hypothetical protein
MPQAMMERRCRLRLAMLIVFALLYLLRRPADALYPYVWAEDGLFNIPLAIDHGWGSVLIPLNGYLVVPTKLVTLSSLSISGLFYPEVAYGLTFLVTLAVLAVLTSRYVALPTSPYLPVVIALLPYNPEVFSTPLYTFWWTSLLLLVPLLAPPKPTLSPKDVAIVSGLIVMGGLSSPLCIVLWPMMLLRACLTKARQDYGWLAVWTGATLIQFSLALFSRPEADNLTLGGMINTGALPRFIGNFVLYDGWLAQDNLLTYLLFVELVAVAISLLATSIRARHLETFYQAFPLVGLFGSIMAALARLGGTPDPMVAGPRYFFFPYIFLALFLLATVAYARRPWVRYGCIGLLVAACTLTWVSDYSQFFRLHDPLDWRAELQTCVQSTEPTPINIHSDGTLDHLWSVNLTPEACLHIANSGILARFYGLNGDLLPQF